MLMLKNKTLLATHAAAFNTFRVRIEGISARKRSKFDEKRRQEVQAVRHRRACLRCALLHIPCSSHDICIPCRQLALGLQSHEKQALPFSGCIRTKPSKAGVFEDHLPPLEYRDMVMEKARKLALSFSGCIRTIPSHVSIFELYTPSPEARVMVMDKARKLASFPIYLQFESQVRWHLGALVDDIVQWINTAGASNTSKVGILSSPQFMHLARSSVEKNTLANFQQMIYALSLAHTQRTIPGKHHFSNSDLYQIGSVAGHALLQTLDSKLKPQHLKNCCSDELRVLFLLIFGTILAVGYTDPVQSEGISISSEHSHHFTAMQRHLCQILAHYLIYLGSQLKLPITREAGQFIIQAASARWYREGRFDWRLSHRVGSESWEELGSNHNRSDLTRDPHDSITLSDCGGGSTMDFVPYNIWVEFVTRGSAEISTVDLSDLVSHRQLNPHGYPPSNQDITQQDVVELPSGNVFSQIPAKGMDYLLEMVRNLVV